MLFGCFTVILNIFTPIKNEIDGIAAFSTQPFMMPAIIILAIIIGEGFAWLHDNLKRERHPKIAFTVGIICLLPAAFALGKNFIPNNESKNYLAHDFNLLALESLPPNAYLISIGKDNMTFPLYYLRKVENIRPDIHLEIHYSTAEVNEEMLKDRVAKNNGNPVFIDLLPANYGSMKLTPYNFVYKYGDDVSLPPETIIHPVIRGIRSNTSYPDTRLKNLYYIKTGILEKDRTLRQKAFDQVINGRGDNSHYINIIGDYAYLMHDYEIAKKAYEKSNNGYGLQKTNDAINNPNHMEDENSQTGMS